MQTGADQYFLSQALIQARPRKGFTAPNPAVGAVVVKQGQIIATGTHWQAGQAHAEVAALATLPAGAASGATLYVTLEPCCHTGKTPPCVDAIIQAGLARVVFAELDPNPHVAGQGAARLRSENIACEQLTHPEIERFYHSYRYRLQNGMPWLCAKLALTLDGKIAGPKGQPLAITQAEARDFTHRQRLQHEAILTSVKTIHHDAPQFSVRLPGAAPIAKPLVVLDSQAKLSLQASIWQTASQVYVIHAEQACPDNVAALAAKGAVTLAVPLLSEHHLDLRQALLALGGLGFHDVWLEAGGTLFQSFAELQLINEAYCYVAPWWAGSEAQSAFTSAPFFQHAQRHQWLPLGEDIALHLEF